MFRDVLPEVVVAAVEEELVVEEDATLHRALVMQEQRMEFAEDVKGAVVVAHVEVEEDVTGVGGAIEEEDVVEGNQCRIQRILTVAGRNASHYFLNELLTMIIAVT
jgi:hypothetical protein